MFNKLETFGQMTERAKKQDALFTPLKKPAAQDPAQAAKTEEKKKKEEEKQLRDPTSADIVGMSPEHLLGGGTFSILNIVEHNALGLGGGNVQILGSTMNIKKDAQLQAAGFQAGVHQAGNMAAAPAQQNPADPNAKPADPNAKPADPNAKPADPNAKPADSDEPPRPQGSGKSILAQEDDIKIDVQIDAKGGKADRYGNFRNFLATDNVPDTIFGYPVVQDERGYTEKDIEFFRKNPKAAGFYDLGDTDDETPQTAYNGGDSRRERTETSVSQDMADVNTEEGIYNALYQDSQTLNGEQQRQRAYDERVSRYDEESQRHIRESGADLESIPMVRDGETGHWDRSMLSEKVKDGTGEIEVLRDPGDRVPGVGYGRAYSLPGASKVVVPGSIKALGEELRHLVTRVFSRTTGGSGGSGGLPSDTAAAAARNAGLPRDAAYHVYGDEGERSERMLSLKASSAKVGFDLANGDDRNRLLDWYDSLEDKDLEDIPRQDAVMLREMSRLRKMNPEYMSTQEREAWRDLNSDSYWKQAKAGNPRNADMA